MAKYYALDPWYSYASVNGKNIKVVFDTGNDSNSFIACKKFPELPRTPIPVPPDVMMRFNLKVAPKFRIPTVEAGISMKDLYKHIVGHNVQRRIPQDQYHTLMQSLGFVFTQTGGGGSHIINLEIASLSIDISGLPFPLTVRAYCSYIDSEWDALLSMKYIASLLEKRIIVTPTSRTAPLYAEYASLQRDIERESLNIHDIDALIESDTESDRLAIFLKKTRSAEIRATRVPAKEIFLSGPQ